MTLIDMSAYRLLVDCGIAQGDAAADWRLPEDARSAHSVVLTHGHWITSVPCRSCSTPVSPNRFSRHEPRSTSPI